MQQVKGIKVSLQDRWLLLGTSGMGKTTFAQKLCDHLLKFYPSAVLYVLDTGQKGGDFDDYPGIVYQDDAPLAIKKGVQVWRPSINDPRAFDEWFWNILQAGGPGIVLIDEIASLVKRQGQDAPPNFQRLMKQGRGKHLCVINCTQEMSPNPKPILTQTVHVVRFQMGGIENGYDRRASNLLIRRPGNAPEPAKYAFDYVRVDEPMPPIRYSGHQAFF